MSLTVINLDTQEEAAIFGDQMLELARRLADQLGAQGEHWAVIRVKTEIVYEVNKDANATTKDAADPAG